MQRVYDFQTVQAEFPEVLEQLLRPGTAVLDKITASQRLPADSQASEGNEVVE